MDYPDVHRAIAAKLRFFTHEHLPPRLRAISEPFCLLAHTMIEDKDLAGPEALIMLNRLMEAKDAAVRAALPAEG